MDIKEQMIEEYRQEILALKEEIMCKEEVIETLTNTILSKGQESAQLAEKLSIIKNQLIDAGIFNQKFMVQKIDNKGPH